MNLFQLASILLGLLGAVFGFQSGLEALSWPGAVAGASLGLVAGWILGGALVGLAFLIAIRFERIRVHLLLKPHFGKYWLKSRDSNWTALRDTLPPGSQVHGQCVAEMYFGWFFDTGHRFPALLNRIQTTSQLSRTPEYDPEKHRLLVHQYDDHERTISLRIEDTDRESDPASNSTLTR
jgi:hypothetical protein